LTNEAALRVLRPFLGGAHTLTSAARDLGRSPSSLAYWVPKLARNGLIECVELAARRGPPMPVYRSVAQQLCIPLPDLPFDDRVRFLDAGRLRLLRRFLDGVDEALQREPGVSLGFSSRDDNALEVQLIEPSERPPQRTFTDGWWVLSLEPDDAAALAREMDDLLERYARLAGGATYVAHVGVVREPRLRWRSASDAATRSHG
jgi:hypothetical protein